MHSFGDGIRKAWYEVIQYTSEERRVIICGRVGREDWWDAGD